MRLAQSAFWLAALAAVPVHAATVAVTGGGNAEAVVAGLAAQWIAAAPLRAGAGSVLRYGVEVDALNLHARQARKFGVRDIVAVGATPMLRIEWPGRALRPFVEGGVGAHLLSHTQLQGGPRLGTAFQFGEWIGTGIRLGPAGAWELALRIEHMSNADIKLPNDGITFAALRAAWRF